MWSCDGCAAEGCTEEREGWAACGGHWCGWLSCEQGLLFWSYNGLVCAELCALLWCSCRENGTLDAVLSWRGEIKVSKVTGPRTAMLGASVL